MLIPDASVTLVCERLNLSCVVENERMKCDICGREEAEWLCVVCDSKMVCMDCDEKWHQHPKRRSHVREPLYPQQAKIVNDPTSCVSSPGYFTRTSLESKMTKSSSAPESVSVRIELQQREDTTNVADANTMASSTETVEPLLIEESPAVQRTNVNLLPMCIADINEDLSYRSLFGIKDSLVSEQSLPKLNTPRHIQPAAVRGLSSNKFSSLTSDFQSTLQSLQSKIHEVNSMVSGQNGRQDIDWSLPGAVSKQTETRIGLHHASSTEVESNQPAARNASTIDEDAELALLLAQAKYPPNMGVTGSPLPRTRAVANEQVTASAKPQNYGLSANSRSSRPHHITSGTGDMAPGKGLTQRLFNMQQHRVNVPGTNTNNTLPVETRSSSNSASNDVLCGDESAQPVVARQRSQTRVKQRLTDVPGVVLPRVGDGNDLGVLERLGGGSEADYHSKFSDIHDEVTCFIYFTGTERSGTISPHGFTHFIPNGCCKHH